MDRRRGIYTRTAQVDDNLQCSTLAFPFIRRLSRVEIDPTRPSVPHILRTALVFGIGIRSSASDAQCADRPRKHLHPKSTASASVSETFNSHQRTHPGWGDGHDGGLDACGRLLPWLHTHSLIPDASPSPRDGGRRSRVCGLARRHRPWWRSPASASSPSVDRIRGGERGNTGRASRFGYVR